MNIRLRPCAYALASIGLACVLGWVGRNTWRELHQLHQNFESAQVDAFHLSEFIEGSVLGLDEIVLRFDSTPNPADQAAFKRLSEQLLGRIRAAQAADTSPGERDLVSQIDRAFAEYRARIGPLIEDRGPAEGNPPPRPRSMVQTVQGEAAPIQDLCKQLKVAERTAQAKFMQDSHLALHWLQQLLAVLLGLLVVILVVAGVAIYRGVIGPLRVKLSESRALAARHEKLASLGTLAAGVAHEIRNPLTAINIRLHSLGKNLVPNSSEQEDAQVIGREIQRLERIVQGFLQFARPADPKLLMVSADSLLAKVQTLLSPQLAKASLQLHLESVPDIWVRADPHQLEQVLINLIQNAADSMESGGVITLRVRTGSARLRARAGRVVIIEVSDTGKGIPPEVRKRIFDPFFTTKDEGTGLGLAIAARIVEKHGGSLECRFEVRQGTTFSILLPHTTPEDTDEDAP